MKYVHRSAAWLRVALLIAAVALLVSQSANAAGRMTLTELVGKSDRIFLGVCAKKSTVFRDGNIITTYKMKPMEVWKGTLDLDSEGLLTMEEIGGVLPGPIPLAEAVVGARPMTPGEEVLLFARDYHQSPDLVAEGVGPALRDGNPIPVERDLGRLSVLTHPATRAKYVTLPDPRSRNLLGSDKASQEFLDRKLRDLEKVKAPKPLTVVKPNDSISDFDTLDSIRDRVKTIVQGENR